MKRLAKILALFLFVVIIIGVFHSITVSEAANPNDTCPVLGNNLIANLDPKVMTNLRTGYRNAGGKDSCPLTATFLFRSPDFDNPKLMDAFFKSAATNNVQVIVRVANDGYIDASGTTHWFPIDKDRAIKDANSLNNAIRNANLPTDIKPIAVFGNEINFPVEWEGTSDLNQRSQSYTESLIAFAEKAKTFNTFNVSMGPLSLSGPDPESFWATMFETIKDEKGGTGRGACRKTLNWINSNIYGYGVNLYTHQKSLDGAGKSDLSSDFDKTVGLISKAWAQTNCTVGTPITDANFVVTEFGIKDGAYIPGMENFLWQAYQQLLESPFGSQISAVTSFNWQLVNRKTNVRAFYYIFNGNSVITGQYDPAAINLGGSTASGFSYGPTDSSSGSTDSDLPKYPPLGSLQICPPEIKSDSAFGQQIEEYQPSGGICNIEPQPEYTACKDPSLIGKDGNPSDDEWCHGPTLSKFCNPASAEEYLAKGGHDCGSGDPTKLGIYGEGFRVTCLSPNSDNPWAQSWISYQQVCINKTRSATKEDEFKFGADKEKIAMCLDYFGGSSSNPNEFQGVRENLQGLPACVPTYNESARCVSECGQPISMTERLQIREVSTTVGECLANNKCRAQIAIKNKEGSNSFALPFAAKLGDYFAGILDAEHSSTDKLDKLQKDLRNITTSQQAFTTYMNEAGLVSKTIPGEIQDKLKCDFINHVKTLKANGKNTKYVERIGGNLTGKEFTVFEKNITEIECRPQRSEFRAVQEDDYYKADNEWKVKFGKYWAAVPLFANEDSQGEIQFINPTVFGTLSDNSITGQNDDRAQYGPVYVTLPEIQRLSAATAVLQSALIPKDDIEIRNSLITNADPAVKQKNLPTYGKEIDPNSFIPLNACSPKEWGDFYNDTAQIIYDESKNYRIDELSPTTQIAEKLVPGTTKSGGALTEYSRAVTCDVNSIAGDPDSRICTIGPNGEIRCSVQDKAGGKYSTEQPHNETVSVQVRTVFPHLFDIAEQTITPGIGILQLFKLKAVELGKEDEFNKAFDPIPASTNNIYYYLPTSTGLSIDDTGHSENGWEIYFYKLGGLWNAQKFVLELLQPKGLDTAAGDK